MTQLVKKFLDSNKSSAEFIESLTSSDLGPLQNDIIFTDLGNSKVADKTKKSAPDKEDEEEIEEALSSLYGKQIKEEDMAPAVSEEDMGSEEVAEDGEDSGSDIDTGDTADIADDYADNTSEMNEADFASDIDSIFEKFDKEG